MKATMTLAFAAAVSSALMVGCDTRTTPTVSSPSTTPAKNVQPDNTGVNKRDRDDAAKTPIDQKENQTDVNVTADIRKRVLAHDNMSVNARNAKIITADGKVTLRGPVDSVAERDAIASIARDVAGKNNVDDQLEVDKN